MPRVMIVDPVSAGAYGERTLRSFAAVAAPGYEVECFHLERGPAAIGSAYDAALAAPGVAALAGEAEGWGFDGVVINCFLEPGLAAAREAARVPVVGLGQASCLTAQAVAERYGIIGVLPQDAYLTWWRTAGYNGGKLVAVRVLDPMAWAAATPEHTRARLVEVAVQLVRQDGCDAVVLGCGAMPSIKEEVADLGAPVIEPGPAAAALIRSLITLGLAQSKLSAPFPARR